MAQSVSRSGNSTEPALPQSDIEVNSATAGGDTDRRGGTIPGGRDLSGDMAVRRNLQVMNEPKPGACRGLDSTGYNYGTTKGSLEIKIPNECGITDRWLCECVTTKILSGDCGW